MDQEIYNRQVESLKQEKQREIERHNNTVANLERRKQSENEQHNRKIQSINERIYQLKKFNLVSSYEAYLELYDTPKIIEELKMLFQRFT